MFKWLKKDPIIGLEKKYAEVLEQATRAQRNGDIEKYSKLSFQSQEILKQIDELTNDKKNDNIE